MLKFLTILIDGKQKLVSAINSSSGAADQNSIIATDATGKLDLSFIPPGLDVSANNITASETLAAGEFINIYDDGGTVKVRKADGENNRPAHGFILSAIANTASGLVYTQGVNNQLSGLTIGSKYFLSSTPGDVSLTPILDTGELKSNTILQVLGTAISATELRFEFDDPVYIE